MTHSVSINDPNGYGVEVLYELSRDIWEGDIDGALQGQPAARHARRRPEIPQAA
jgi:hypothetical protein